MNKEKNQDDLILAINNLIKETNLNEFEELNEAINNIELEVDKIYINTEKKDEE